MKDFEANLKLIQDFLSLNEMLLTSEIPALKEYDYKVLSAMGLISLHPAGDNEQYITLTDKGHTYFYNKKQSRNDFIKDNLFRFISGFVCGVLTTVISAWLLGQLPL